jgi:tol-pal system protein YbgF
VTPTTPHPRSRAALRFWCCAVLLWTAAPAHAGLFDDDDARKQISAERKRVDDMKAQQDAIDARMAKVEEALKSQALLDLFTQLEGLKTEMNKLRGQIEVLNNSVENTSKRQRDMYLDLDTRVRRFEQQGAPAAPAPGATPSSPPASAPAAPAPAAKPGASAPSAAGIVPAVAVVPATTAAAPASAAPTVPAVATINELGGENRVYEAAQGQRRIGNYQGAIAGFQNFLKQYPKSNLAPRAQYWIGDSYFNLREFNQAIASQQVLQKNYPNSPTVPDSMLNMASSQIEMGDAAAGRKTLEDILAKFPISDAANKAKRRLTTLSASEAPAGGGPASKP